MNAFFKFSFCLIFISQAQASQFPSSPGHRYDIGGYSLHIHCKGSGQPTVLIDAGLGDDSREWFEIQNQLSSSTRTCVYDRPGYGWSDVGPEPRSSLHISQELAKLLQAAKETGPYILVGHSFGGYNMRLFAAKNHHQVKGLVLVDASHENQYELLNIKLPTQYDRRKNIIILPKATDATLTDKQAMFQERAYHAARAEITALHQSTVEVKHSRYFPQIPVTVISRGKPEWTTSPDGQQREKIWLGLQQDLSKLSSHSQHLFAFNSGHDIHLSQPEIITDAIADIVEMNR